MSRYAVAYVDIAAGFELDIIAACVIGGISIAGGIGSVPGAVLGALFLGVIKNALPVINISPFAQMAISGMVIIIGRCRQCACRTAQGTCHPQKGGGCLMAETHLSPATFPIASKGAARAC